MMMCCSENDNVVLIYGSGVCRCSSLTSPPTASSSDEVLQLQPRESHSLAIAHFSTHCLSATCVLVWSTRMEKTMTHAGKSSWHVLVAGSIRLHVSTWNNQWVSCDAADGFDVTRLGSEQLRLLLPLFCSCYTTPLTVNYHQSDAEIPHGANFRHAVIASVFQAHKRSNKCSLPFPDDVPTCCCYSQPPTHLILSLCAYVFL